MLLGISATSSASSLSCKRSASEKSEFEYFMVRTLVSSVLSSFYTSNSRLSHKTLGYTLVSGFCTEVLSNLCFVQLLLVYLLTPNVLLPNNQNLKNFWVVPFLVLFHLLFSHLIYFCQTELQAVPCFWILN